MVKAKYKLKNWSVYNKSLIKRGSITLWISNDLEQNWFYKIKKNGSKSIKLYSDTAIELCLTVKALYKMPLRMTQGFLESLFVMTNLKVKCPDYTTISRRGKKLNIKLKRYQNIGSVTDIAVDSTGIKVYGEGEWKVRQHGIGKRRTWRKLHIGIDPLSHEVLAQAITDNKTTDDQMFETLINQVPEEIERAFGDGAYDKASCYDTCHNKNITPIIPPQKKARLQKERSKCAIASKIPRDNNIERIRALTEKSGNLEEARKEWKIESDYHTRSVVETAMLRYKTIFGDKLLSRNFNNQKTEMLIKTNILNKFTSLGMPESVPVYG